MGWRDAPLLDAQPKWASAPLLDGADDEQPRSREMLRNSPSPSTSIRQIERTPESSGSVLDPLIERGRERLAEAANRSPVPKHRGVAINATAGANEALADMLGAPVDVVNWLIKEGMNSLGGRINPGSRAIGLGDVIPKGEDVTAEKPLLGSRSIKEDFMGAVGADPGDTEAITPAERFARAAGGGAAMVLAPEMALGRIGSLKNAAGALTTGATSGVGAEAAMEVTPEPFKPLAGVVGGLAGGAGAAGAMAGTGAAFRAARDVGSRAVAPLTDRGVRTLASERLRESATDPDAARAALESVDELVPGSRPTSFQASGDMGLGALERESQTKFPAEFNQRRADQNAARRSQMALLEPGGDPSDLATYVRSSIRRIDEETAAELEGAARTARDRTAGLGGARTPEDYGASLRGAAQGAENTVRERERALWKAVDPNGDLTVSSGRVRLEAKTILSAISKSAKPPTADEKAILDAAANYPKTIPFRELGDLRSYASDAMRQELRANGQTQTYGRLSRMRGAIEAVINNAVERRAQAAPEEVRESLNWYERTLRESAEWQGARRNNAAGLNESTGTGGVSSASRNQGPARGRLGDVEGDQGVPGTPTFDESAAERLRLATTATRERADTFGRGPVGAILKKAGRQDQYALPDSGVPSRLFRPGKSGAEDVQAYRRAAGDNAEAADTLQDYAASALRRAAGQPDGTLDPNRARTWLSLHRDALRAMPEGLQQRFKNATTASEAIAAVAARRRQALDQAQAGAFARIANLESPEDVTRTVGQILGSRDRVAQMRQLATRTEGNEEARLGLRRAVADHIASRFVSNTEAAASGQTQIKSDAFQTFMRENRAALSSAFTDDELNSMNAIAADLQRANRSITAVRLPGQSNTAQDLAGPQASRKSILRRFMAEGGAALGGTMATGGAGGGVLGWLGAKTVISLRNAGYSRVDELVRDAMLDPQLARALLAPAPDNARGFAASRLRATVAERSVWSAAAGAQNAAESDGRKAGREAMIDPNKLRIAKSDGSFSTERTITIESDGRFLNIPTIVGGRQRTEKEATLLWRTGRNNPVGEFDSLDEAEEAARRRSSEIGRRAQR